MKGKIRNAGKCLAVSCTALAAATGVGSLFRQAGFSDTNIVLLYILAVLAVSGFTPGYLAGILTSVAGTLAFNYFFTAPYHTLNVYDPGYLVTFAVMTAVAMVTSALTSRAIEGERIAQEKEKEARELYQLSQSLEKARQETIQERYRGNLLRAISHDLRTPLSGIMGTSEMIMDMSQKEDPRYQLASGIRKDARWLHALVENILSLTRLQEGKLALHRELEAAEEVIGGAIEQMSIRAPEYEVTVHMPDEVLMLPMDAKLIMQVLINLLDNAVKHSSPDEEISISVTKDAEHRCAVFVVADRGEGIRQKDLPKIFQMFYTTQEKPADGKKGIGLGLAICETIVKAHGGSISARNRSDGPGAEFLFTLPLSDKKEEQNEPVS